MDEKITYRWLLPEEYDIIDPIIVANGGDTPDPSLSMVYGAFLGSSLVGFHVLQFCAHAEPLWIDPEFRGRVSWREFQRGIESLFDRAAGGVYYIFPESERVAKLCERGGMQRLPYPIYVKEVSAATDEGAEEEEKEE